MQQASSLSTDLDAASAATEAAEAAAWAGAGRNDLDPQRILVLEVRGFVGRAQRIEIALFLTGRCGGETRQLEDHPRAFVQLTQADGQLLPFGCHLDLGTRHYG